MPTRWQQAAKLKQYSYISDGLEVLVPEGEALKVGVTENILLNWKIKISPGRI